MVSATEFDSNQRIEFLEQKQEDIRKKYMHYKQEVAIIDKKRKKLRRKQREGMYWYLKVTFVETTRLDKYFELQFPFRFYS